MRHQDRTVDDVIARIARQQHGVVTRSQLLAAGVTRSATRARLERGALLIAHRGVYRVGHEAPNIHATYLAAVLAGGDGTLLGGRAAGHLLGALEHAARPEIVTPTERRIDGVTTHRTRTTPTHGTTWRGIPVTTPARTLVDLAADLNDAELARACHEMGIHHGTAPDEIEEVLGARPTSPGARRLRRVIHGDVPVALSTLERRFLALVEHHGLPRPQTNVVASGRRVDCRWPARRLTVELDGYRFHRSRHAWERDRQREREARRRGDEFRRFTYADVLEDNRYVIDELTRLLVEHPA